MKQLSINNYRKAQAALQEVRFNHYFARSVIKKHVNGSVYADCPDRPTTFYVVHPYGMSLLFGRSDNIEFNRQFKEYVFRQYNSRKPAEWMQAYPHSWDKVLHDLFQPHMVSSDETHMTSTSQKIMNKRKWVSFNQLKQVYSNETCLSTTPINENEHAKPMHSNVVVLNTRVNFRFHPEKYKQIRSTIDIKTHRIVRADKALFHQMEGSVIPKHFWDRDVDFLSNGVGFCVMHDDKPAAFSFSAFVHDSILELGIETIASCRGRGFAILACAALIDYCLESNLEPVWSCRLENIGSYKLALKLGFESVMHLPYYKLCG
jgi:hypothetical protein